MYSNVGCVSVHTLKLILCWSTFWFYYSIKSFWVGAYQHGIFYLGNLFPLFHGKSTSNLSNYEGISCTRSSVGLLLFNWIQVQNLAESFQNFDLLVKPFFYWFGGMLWVIVLKGEIPLHRQHFSRDIKVLCQNRLIIGTAHNSLHLNHSPNSTEEKQAKSIMLPSPCFTVDMVYFWS